VSQPTPKPSQQRLIHTLSDGEIHSGEELGEILEISRAGIWKQIQALEPLGIAVQKLKGSGYQISGGLDLLQSSLIESQLQASTLEQIESPEVLFSIGSTNDWVLEALKEGCGNCVVLTEHQTAGKGRRGRVWQSPFASSLYMTFGWRFVQGFSAIEGLSLIVGLQVLEVLEEFGAKGVELKWPNDLVWHNRKLAGILMEVQGDPVGECEVAIGIGLNVNFGHVLEQEIDQPWVDLREIMPESVPGRNALAAAIIDRLATCLQDVPKVGFPAYQKKWNRFDAFKNEQVYLQAGDNIIVGTGGGVDRSGAYGIKTDNGTQFYSGGEISLRQYHGQDSEDTVEK